LTFPAEFHYAAHEDLIKSLAYVNGKVQLKVSILNLLKKFIQYIKLDELNEVYQKMKVVECLQKEILSIALKRSMDPLDYVQIAIQFIQLIITWHFKRSEEKTFKLMVDFSTRYTTTSKG